MAPSDSQNLREIYRVYDSSTEAFPRAFAAGGGLIDPTYLIFTSQPTALPEPASLTLLGLGALARAGYARCRRGSPR